MHPRFRHRDRALTGEQEHRYGSRPWSSRRLAAIAAVRGVRSWLFLAPFREPSRELRRCLAGSFPSTRWTPTCSRDRFGAVRGDEPQATEERPTLGVVEGLEAAGRHERFGVGRLRGQVERFVHVVSMNPRRSPNVQARSQPTAAQRGCGCQGTESPLACGPCHAAPRWFGWIVRSVGSDRLRRLLR